MEFYNFQDGEMGLRKDFVLCLEYSQAARSQTKGKKNSKRTKANGDVNDPVFSTITCWKKIYLYYIVTFKDLVQCYLETVINRSLSDF